MLFKVGDRVRIKTNKRIGIVNSVASTTERYYIIDQEDQLGIWLDKEDLEAVEETLIKFKVGDRVRIKNGFKMGRVDEIYYLRYKAPRYSVSYSLDVDRMTGSWFYEEELEDFPTESVKAGPIVISDISKFKVGDKVVISGSTRVGTVISIREHKENEGPFGRPYYVDFGTLHGYKDVRWIGEEALVLFKKKLFQFKMEVDDAQLYQGHVKIPWYMGRSYSDYCTAVYYYHMMPFNFLMRYFRYLYYAWFSFTKGPEHFVIMDRRSFEQVLRAEYELGRQKADEYFEREVTQAAFRRDKYPHQ